MEGHRDEDRQRDVETETDRETVLARPVTAAF